MNTRKIMAFVGRYAVWIVSSMITILPIWWMIVISARSRVQLFDDPSLLIRSFYSQNYSNVIFDEAFQGYMINSIVVSAGNAILVTVLAVLATYALSRYDLVGKDSIFFTTLTQRMAPPAAFLLPLFLLYTQVITFQVGGAKWDLYDTRFGLILLYCVFNLPFAVWLMKGIMDGIPVDIDEAAYVDGASTWGVITRIILPLVTPGVAVTLILSFVFAWNEYLLAATLTAFDARTITTGLAEFVTVTGTNWGEMAAVSALTLIPSIIVVLFAQRYIVTGLTFGAVKD